MKKVRFEIYWRKYGKKKIKHSHVWADSKVNAIDRFLDKHRFYAKILFVDYDREKNR